MNKVKQILYIFLLLQLFVQIYSKSHTLNYHPGSGITRTTTGKYAQRVGNLKVKNGYSGTTTGTLGHVEHTGQYTTKSGYSGSTTFSDRRGTGTIERGSGYTLTKENQYGQKTIQVNRDQGHSINTTMTGSQGDINHTSSYQRGSGYSGSTNINYDGQTYTHSTNT